MQLAYPINPLTMFDSDQLLLVVAYIPPTGRARLGCSIGPGYFGIMTPLQWRGAMRSPVRIIERRKKGNTDTDGGPSDCPEP